MSPREAAVPASALTIRPWSVEDAAAIEPMLAAFLCETPGDVAATPRSVAALRALGLVAAAAGDPCVLAVLDGVPIGFLFWLGFPMPFDTRGHPCQAMGSYIVPAHRNRGYGTALRREGLRIARQRGYTRVLTTAYGPQAARSLGYAGFAPIGQIMEASWR